MRFVLTQFEGKEHDIVGHNYCVPFHEVTSFDEAVGLQAI